MFEAFPKIARLQRDCVITEKLDGTNAQVFISFGDAPEYVTPPVATVLSEVGPMHIRAGSRSRWLTCSKTGDNFGFAHWVQENALELVKLGPGRHFGEWFGHGIQRNYGLQEKRFALFDVHKWRDNENDVKNWSETAVPCPACCTVVPMVFLGPFSALDTRMSMDALRICGSRAVPGFMSPEGIIIFHTAARVLFKQTFDDAHKEAA